MSRTEHTLSVDQAIELLASSRRRRLLRYLARETDDPVNREELVRWVRPEEGRQLNEMRIALAHHHLPKLADAGLIEYDHRSGVVRPTEGIEALQPLLTACERVEESWG